MELFSLKFILFIVVSLFVYYGLYKIAPRRQWVVLLVISMVFYSWSAPINFVFIFITAITVYLGGLRFQGYSEQYSIAKKSGGVNKDELKVLKNSLQNKRRILLYVILIINFGILAYIKYWHTLFEGFTALFHVGQDVHLSKMLLPLGISFYMFQASGYLIDVYNAKYDAEKNFFKFLLFVSFFPQLIQGPINRFNQMSNDLYTPHSFDWEKTKKALFLILLGLLKKYAVANLLAGSVAQILDKPQINTPGSVIVFGIFLYSIQQYADFSGGIDMVLGVAELFGIKMMQNFRQPYFSVSLSDFWRRWHISLGAWMRDYIFYPFALTKMMQRLGKNIGKPLGKHFSRTIPAGLANLLVFFIVGLWHGAELHFILWGLYNGIVIALSDILSPAFNRISSTLKIPTGSKPFHIFRIIRTFIIVNIGWYFDRIENVKDCMMCFKNTVCNFNGHYFIKYITLNLYTEANKRFVIGGLLYAALVMMLIFGNSILLEKKVDIYNYLQKKNIAVRWAAYYMLIFLIIASFMFRGGAGEFIYAQF